MTIAPTIASVFFSESKMMVLRAEILLHESAMPSLSKNEGYFCPTPRNGLIGVIAGLPPLLRSWSGFIGLEHRRFATSLRVLRPTHRVSGINRYDYTHDKGPYHA